MAYCVKSPVKGMDDPNKGSKHIEPCNKFLSVYLKIQQTHHIMDMLLELHCFSFMAVKVCYLFTESMFFL